MLKRMKTINGAEALIKLFLKYTFWECFNMKKASHFNAVIIGLSC